MMDLPQIMKQQRFAVLGDTINEDKYAYKIKRAMMERGYTVYAVGKELASLNEIEGGVDVIDLCINPIKGLQLLRECNVPYKCIVIQPGAANDELLAYLNEQRIDYIDACLLVGLSLYTRK